MSIHTGIDLVEIGRIKDALVEHEESFLNRICTAREIQQLPGHGQKQRRTEEKVAGIFALKEAFAKALGTGIGAELGFHDLQVSHTSKGQPRIEYVGTKFDHGSWEVACSLSHDGGMVAAVVVIQGTIR